MKNSKIILKKRKLNKEKIKRKKERRKERQIDM